MNEQIILGSGDLYVCAYTAGSAIPSDATIETEANKIGYISGGASLEYKPTELEVKDDSGAFMKRFTISEEVTFKSGVLTWNVETLQKLSQVNSYSDREGVRTLKLGGKGAREMTQYVVHFVHNYNASNNNLKITLVGTASNGFSLSFAKDSETVIDAEFKAVPHDATGTQVIITEEYDSE